MKDTHFGTCPRTLHNSKCFVSRSETLEFLITSVIPFVLLVPYNFWLPYSRPVCEISTLVTSPFNSRNAFNRLFVYWRAIVRLSPRRASLVLDTNGWQQVTGNVFSCIINTGPLFYCSPQFSRIVFTKTNLFERRLYQRPKIFLMSNPSVVPSTHGKSVTLLTSSPPAHIRSNQHVHLIRDPFPYLPKGPPRPLYANLFAHFRYLSNLLSRFLQLMEDSVVKGRDVRWKYWAVPTGDGTPFTVSHRQIFRCETSV